MDFGRFGRFRDLYAHMRGIVADDSCCRVILDLLGDLRWGRDALFITRESLWSIFVTVSCPGQLIMFNFIRTVWRPERACAWHCSCLLLL